MTSPNLVLNPQELSSTIEALRDAIFRRLRWSTSEEFDQWRRLPIDTVQIVIDSMTSAYTKLMMEYRDGDFLKLPEFELAFGISDELWDMLAVLTIATDWDGVPFHPHHALQKCHICRDMSTMA